MMMIETQGLYKSFGDHVVLDNIDLDVAEGTPDELKRRIPGGHIRLQFADASELEAIARTLGEVACDDYALTLQSGSIWSNRAIKSINSDGAMMDKLTYAALKGLEADVSKVTVLS